jgi:hypothetical protein
MATTPTIFPEGEWLGAEEFVSFDTKALSRLQLLGHKARLLQ